MYQFVETIRMENEIPQNIRYHNLRLNKTIGDIYGLQSQIDISDYLTIPPQGKLTKCRVIYSQTIDDIEYAQYTPRNVKTLQVIEDNNIAYSHKSTDRNHLNQLYERRDKCDDIIIIKNGFITDSWVSNIVLFDGDGWFTPTTPLLHGTHRQLLLDKGNIQLMQVRALDLPKFQKIRLINAMASWENSPEISISNIVF